MEGCCRHGNETSGSIKCREFLGYLRKSWLGSKTSVESSIRQLFKE